MSFIIAAFSWLARLFGYGGPPHRVLDEEQEEPLPLEEEPTEQERAEVMRESKRLENELISEAYHIRRLVEFRAVETRMGKFYVPLFQEGNDAVRAARNSGRWSDVLKAREVVKRAVDLTEAEIEKARLV